MQICFQQGAEEDKCSVSITLTWEPLVIYPFSAVIQMIFGTYALLSISSGAKDFVTDLHEFGNFYRAMEVQINTSQKSHWLGFQAEEGKNRAA